MDFVLSEEENETNELKDQPNEPSNGLNEPANELNGHANEVQDECQRLELIPNEHILIHEPPNPGVIRVNNGNIMSSNEELSRPIIRSNEGSEPRSCSGSQTDITAVGNEESAVKVASGVGRKPHYVLSSQSRSTTTNNTEEGRY